MTATHTSIAGIPIPDSAIAREATVWEAIALHTTPEVPRYKQPEVRLVNLGVDYDVVGSHFEELSPEQREEVLTAHPRTGFKDGIIEAFSAAMRDKPPSARLHERTNPLGTYI